jgi:hypothetical protein
MHKIASDLSQRRARQLWLADLQGSKWEELPFEQNRANLVRAVQALSEQAKTLPKKSEERKAIGQLIYELNQRINALRPKLKGPASTPQHFVDVARERLTPFLFKSFMHEASLRAQREEEEE